MRTISLLLMLSLLTQPVFAGNPGKSEGLPGISVERLLNAIYRAEGGSKTKHPYGIIDLKRFKGLSARKVSKNTIKHRYRLWALNRQTEPFLEYLSKSYAPIGAANDPSGLNRHWLSNVEYWYERG